jgi:hypothetical protein
MRRGVAIETRPTAQAKTEKVSSTQKEFGKARSQETKTRFSDKGETTSTQKEEMTKVAWKVGKGEVKRTGVRRRRRGSFIVRKRVIAPYGRELPTMGVK